MLDSLITSRTRISLLLKFFLNSGTKAYLRELAKELGESTNSIRIELNRLTAAKLLQSEPDGRTILYSANKDHALFSDIESIVRKYVGIDRIAVTLVEQLGYVEQAYITGDYAEGKDSGLIDLVIIGVVDQEVLRRLTLKTESIISRKIRVLVLEKDESESLSSLLNLRKAYLLWGKNDLK